LQPAETGKAGRPTPRHVGAPCFADETRKCGRPTDTALRRPPLYADETLRPVRVGGPR